MVVIGITGPTGAGKTTVLNVLAQLGGRIGAVLDGGPCAVGVESTILDLTVTPYRILRRGGLGREAIEHTLGCEIIEHIGKGIEKTS